MFEIVLPYEVYLQVGTYGVWRTEYGSVHAPLYLYSAVLAGTGIILGMVAVSESKMALGLMASCVQ